MTNNANVTNEENVNISELCKTFLLSNSIGYFSPSCLNIPVFTASISISGKEVAVIV